jgi:excisionase family DNA binding protein
MAQGLERGGAGAGGIVAEMAVGMAMAQQMLNQPGGITAQATPAAGVSAAGSAAIPETLSPAEAARLLGVSEADVIASLESGDLKGKRIGTQWRVTKGQLAQFLQ